MNRPLLLVIEDDQTTSLALKTFFIRKGYGCISAATGRDGISAAFTEVPDVVILDMRLPDMDGIDILKELKSTYPEMPIVAMTGYGEVKEAVEAMRAGAEYFFTKPFDLDELAIIVEKGLAIGELKREAAFYRESPYPIVGRSKHIQGLIHMISLLAKNPFTTVLIQGETGTGKELVARNIHANSSRRDKPFVDINCAAIPETILESELFGHEAGAFTDAKTTKKGLIEIADEGTLFLDEIADMPRSAQAKMLRVLENRSLKRVGGTRDITVNVRIIAATNRDLKQLVSRGEFREDLFYRLNVMPLDIPPLRDRPEDIPVIASFLLEEVKKTMGKKDIGVLTEDGLSALIAYDWPGNVRELRNIIERAVIICQHGNVSAASLRIEPPRHDAEPALSLGKVEEMHIRKVLNLTGGNKSRAAELLGIARSTLNEKLKLYQSR